MSRERRREMVDRQHPALSAVRQCALLGISRSSLYYRSRGTSSEDLAVMKLIDQQYLATPFYGSRRMAVWLKRQGRPVSRKRVQRLMRSMGLQAIYRRPRTSQPASGHKVYPLSAGWHGVHQTQPGVGGGHHLPAHGPWLPVPGGHHGLVQPLCAGLAPVQHPGCRVEALEEALSKGRPEIFNTDQGSQFTGEAFTGLLEQHAARISMDGKGRYTDNIFVERLWRTVKYEEVYLKAYSNGREAKAGLNAYFRFYNTQRPHQALGYRTPAEVFSCGSDTSPEQATERGWSPGHSIGILRRSDGTLA